MKTEEKKRAINLRKEGKSIREIEKILNVSRSSISRWVSHVKLSEEQIDNLSRKSNGFYGAKANKERSRKIREQYQKKGQIDCQTKHKDHKAFCALYWAEGTKNKNSFRFCNSEVEMLVFVINFLREFYKIKNEEFSLRISCYINNGICSKKIEDFWLSNLNLEKTNLRKTTIINSHGNKEGKLKFGVATLDVHRTELVQRVFGSIGKYFAVDSSKWIE